MARAPEDNKDSETGDERPVGLSSMRARMPACRDSAVPAPPMMHDDWHAKRIILWITEHATITGTGIDI